jgi:hypothetical protein
MLDHISLGLEPGKDFAIGAIDPAIARGLNWAVKKIAQGPIDMKGVNGWLNILDLGRFGTDYNTCAAIAWLGPGALWAEDAVYPTAYRDGNGNLLDGTSKYILHIAGHSRFQRCKRSCRAVGCGRDDDRLSVPNAHFGTLLLCGYPYNRVRC